MNVGVPKETAPGERRVALASSRTRTEACRGRTDRTRRDRRRPGRRLSRQRVFRKRSPDPVGSTCSSRYRVEGTATVRRGNRKVPRELNPDRSTRTIYNR
jgi:hypothetical protein